MTLRSQRGFSIIAAIFIVVVLAVLGGVMVTLSGSQHMTATNAALGARAYYAARSGLEWKAGQVIHVGVATCAGGTVALPAYPEFTVTIGCTTTAHTEGAAGYNVFNITATASTTGIALGSPGYVSRTIAMVITDLP